MSRRLVSSSSFFLAVSSLILLLLATPLAHAAVVDTVGLRSAAQAPYAASDESTMGASLSRAARRAKKEKRRPTVAIYRNPPISCYYCPESIGELLETHPLNFDVRYLGPHEKAGDITAETLSQVDLFVQPGGGDDTDTDWKNGAAYFTPALQDYVRNGGNFMGVCLGAFFARGPETNETYFNLMPPGSYVTSERLLPGAQETSAKDTVVQVDWYFHASRNRGKFRPRTWQYFQDGGAIVMDMAHAPKGTVVLGRYSYSGRPSAVVMPYGKGWVGLIGTHPEAQIEDNDWYDLGFENPDGYERDWADDFVLTLWNAAKKGNQAL